MRLFDYLECEHDLPDGLRPDGIVFQTQSLDCDQTSFRITKDGRLIEAYDPPLGDEVSREVRREGTIKFYLIMTAAQQTPAAPTFEDRRRGQHLREYDAYFEKGRLTKIVAIPEQQAGV